MTLERACDGMALEQVVRALLSKPKPNATRRVVACHDSERHLTDVLLFVYEEMVKWTRLFFVPWSFVGQGDGVR